MDNLQTRVRGARPAGAAAETLRRPLRAAAARVVGGLVVALTTAAALAASAPAGPVLQEPQAGGQAPAQTVVEAAGQTAEPKAPKPWPPDAETLRKRRLNAEALALFQSLDPIEFTISADFKTVQRDRDVQSKKLYPGTLSVTTGGVTGPPIPVQLRTRGHVRRNVRLCEFAPLRLEFKKADVKGTIFEGLDKVKLGTHCQGASTFRQYTLKEYLANRLHYALTPRALRSRLAEVTYADTAPNKKPYTKLGIVFEDEDDVAKRVESRVLARQGLMFKLLDQPQLVFMSLFQYMIGNTDYSILVLHNVRMLVDTQNRYIPVPYDFDYSGLVGAHYAAPAKALELSSVEERMYRGPCVPEGEFQAALAPFREKKDEVMGMPATIPGLEEGHRKDAEKYLREFYEIIERPDRFNRVFGKGCKPIGGM